MKIKYRAVKTLTQVSIEYPMIVIPVTATPGDAFAAPTAPDPLNAVKIRFTGEELSDSHIRLSLFE